MKSYSSREVIEILEANGWRFKNARGDHHYYIHDTLKGKVTVQHPKKDIKINNLKDISKTTGIKF